MTASLYLWPWPKQVERLPGALPAHSPCPQAVVDAALPPEHYQLYAPSDAAAQLRVADAAAARHAQATWQQLMAHDPPPAVSIEDGPDFPLRGIMLDISRCRVPTMAQLFAVVDGIVASKGNHLQLYVEHSLAYPGHEAVWADASPLSVDDLAALHQYAAARGVELAANQNTFGHCERWLQHPAYAHLGEYGDVAQRLANGEPGPFSLCPVDPRCRSLARSWLRQQMAVLPAPWVHVGCDETVDVGRGRSAVAVQQRGFAAIWAEHCRAMCETVTAAGRRPLFWADMALEHPQALDQLPQQAVAVAWHYEADAPFARWAEAFAQQQRQWWVAPGTSAWRSWLGRGDARDGSIATAARDGLAAGASGMLVCDWGDLGHRQPWPVSWYGLVQGLGAAWHAAAPMDHGAIGRWALGDAQAGRWLDACSRCDGILRSQLQHPLRGGPLINASAPFVDTCLPWSRDDWAPHVESWQALRASLQEQGPLPSAAPLAAELNHAWLAVDTALWRALARRGAVSSRGLSAAWQWLEQQHAAQWHDRCRPGGLAESCGYYQRLAQETE
ncbi:MAG: hypothetical protein EA401_06390 [Planctomycetota bacterium]|nr:MAG: hypothetical protein EA401_06390 [Planctomycetota bacterium]